MGYQIVENQECYLWIHLECITSYGQNLYLVGNHPSIGDWNIHNAVKLQTDQHKYPLWTCEKAIILPRYFELQFKLVIINADDQSIYWENLVSNRIYNIVHHKSLIFMVHDQPHIYEKQVQKFVQSAQLPNLNIKKIKQFKNYQPHQIAKQSDVMQFVMNIEILRNIDNYIIRYLIVYRVIVSQQEMIWTGYSIQKAAKEVHR